MTVLLFLAVLFVLILVHEWGHFIVAKKNGIRVDEFGVGFPPKLFGIKKGETEYTFNALPIGGFVKIVGENGTEEMPPEDYERSFVAKSKLVQAAVLIAGVTMNVLFAWFLFSLVLLVGVPTSIPESEATADARLVVSEVLPDGPAAEAGIPAGAVITALQAGIDEDRILHPTSFSAFVEDRRGVPITVTYKIGEQELTTTVTPQTGIIESEPDQPAVGVALALVETVSRPIHLAVYDGFLATVKGLRDITVGLSGLIYDSIRGQADLSNIAGPVGIVGLVGDAAEFGWTSLAMFTAFISLNLAVINLLPIPALDGGRLVFVAIEAVTRRPINPVWFARINFAGFALLMLLMLAVTYSDIVKLVS